MRVNGTATLNSPIDAVWAALHDPAVLRRTIPGCDALEALGPDTYRMTVTAGVASIKGSYLGEVRLTDPQPPHDFTLQAGGTGGPGTVNATVKVHLDGADDGTTVLSYDADAVVGGAVGGVGQRVLTGVAKKLAGEFFRAVDADLTAGPAVDAEAVSPATGPVAVPPAFAEPGQVMVDGRRQLSASVIGAATGAAIALAGVWLGWRIARR